MKINFRTSLRDLEQYPFDHDNDVLVLWFQLHKLPLQFGWKFKKFKRDFSTRKYINPENGEELEGLCQTSVIKTYRFVLLPSKATHDIYWSIPSTIIMNTPIHLKENNV